MQTFLPYPSFRKSAAALDWRRLGKQRCEAVGIYRLLTTDRPSPYRRHPAVRIWNGHAPALAAYFNAILEEWIRRGYNNNMTFLTTPTDHPSLPSWFGLHAYHSSHRAALLAKDPVHYGKFGWTERPEIAYVWPV